MSESTLTRLVARIISSDTPIAVFKVNSPDALNGMFADTIGTQKMINDNHPDYIGTFDRAMNPKELKDELSKHIIVPEKETKND